MRGFLAFFGTFHVGMFTEKAFVLSGWPDATWAPAAMSAAFAVGCFVFVEFMPPANQVKE